ncbi:MAG: hypothetical protein LJE65_15370 [Desulfobacteraceae bacterium]|nr:hypothetical protein [Desulfobacteraceae bacterium]
MQFTNHDEPSGRFLLALFEQSRGEPSVTVSMYDIGASLGWDRDDSAHIAEQLIGEGLLEVKTLNGGVSITGEGLAQVRGDEAEAASEGDVRLGVGPILTEDERAAVEGIVAALKTEAGEKSWDFEVLSEVMADLRALDAQLLSPRPKTAIVRECFRSLHSALEASGNRGAVFDRVRTLVGDVP